MTVVESQAAHFWFHLPLLVAAEPAYLVVGSAATATALSVDFKALLAGANPEASVELAADDVILRSALTKLAAQHASSRPGAQFSGM
jgi:hypothetical protein